MTYHVKISNAWKTVVSSHVKISGSWKTVSSMWVKISGVWKLFFTIQGPTQNTRPANTGGSSAAGSQVTVGAAGTYTDKISITTELIKITDGTTPSEAGTTASGTVITSPYTVTQADATTPQQIFYTRDKVLSLDGSTYYYYYSETGATAFIPNFTDNFNRSNNSQEIGTSSAGFVYSSYKNPATNSTDSWGISSNAASNSYIPGFSDAANTYPMRTIEVHKNNISLSVSIPSGGGGPGLAFWVTARGSYWAASTYYYQSSVTNNFCNGSPISTNSSGSGCSCPVESYTCNSNYGFTCNIGDCYGIAVTVPNGCTGSTYYCGTTVYEVGVFDPGPTVTCSSTTVGQICSKGYNLAINQYEVTYCETGTNYTDGYDCYRSQTTCYQCNTITSSTTTTYYSLLKIWSASGSSIVSAAEKELANSTSSYSKIYGLSVSTSGDTITTKGYSDTSLATQMGTSLTHTATGSTKALANGETSVGIIKLNTANNLGSTLDNFTYTRV